MRASRMITALSIGGALGAGIAWVWRHQGAIGVRRPVNEWTFTHMSRIMPVQIVRSAPRMPLPRDRFPLEHVVRYGAAPGRPIAALFDRNHVTSMVVLHRGRVVQESYPGRFASPEARFQLFSLTKSVTSLLVGIAHEDGDLPDLGATVASFLPELSDSAYAEVTVQELLDMRSGVGGAEVWTDPEALILAYERAVMNGGSVFDVIRNAPRVRPAGTAFNYSTVDTHVLGWVLEAAVGTPIADYLGEKIWRPIGAESDAFYFLSRATPRTALGGGSLNATTMDLARVGLLVAQGGVWEGQRIVPEAWIERCRDAGIPELAVGALDPELYPPAYGYSNQWWTFGGAHRAVTGLGVHGQFLFVDPVAGVVVAVTGAWDSADDDARDAEMREAMLAITEALEAREATGEFAPRGSAPGVGGAG
ncbi:serine hydrolase [Leucobacter sp. CSA2]|uniref:Serine hydrolase n=1 Tax=Leucobacter edaphi TaxID=2796472 RepID=A0A934UW37_9MICO|nr:serine hydrolase [Leucobacter edaphi]MBK0421249.1 serine hydrolase [Leucobacter edaphi]